MIFCLPKPFANKVKQAIRTGKFNPEKLNKMTSIERRKFLSEIVGNENAKQVNLLFEKKLLLKNQERAMYDWAKEITGMSKETKEATLKKIQQTYADKKRRLYEPKENEKFLNEIVSDVYSKKMKTDISLKEAQTITELSADVGTHRTKMNADFTWNNIKDAQNFGASKVAFDNYIGALKTEAKKRTLISPLSQKGWERLEAIVEDASIAANFIADNSRAIVASVDNSFWGRQGIKVLFTPKYARLWGRNFLKSFDDIYKTLRYGEAKGNAIIDATKAEIYARKNYLNGRYGLGKKLDVGIVEEEFPTSLPSKIPVFGRLFKAAEVSYEAGAMRLRVDVADAMYKMAEKTGVDLTSKLETGSINQLVNSMTGRGSLGRVEAIAPIVNKAFFSIKFAKSNLDTLFLSYAGKDISSFARKQAALNLLQITAVIGSILGISKAINNDSVQFDPRSANFGKIKIKNTRFDITGGMGAFLILFSRLATQSTKSSVTGKVTKLGEGYGTPDGMDVFWNFTENKFSPMFSVIKEIVQQETFEGNKPTVLNQMKNLTVPIIIQEGAEAIQDEKSANLMLILIADGLGISVGTYSLKTNWEQNTSKEMIQFREKVGEKKFNEANNEFNKKVNDWFSGIENSDKYKNLTSEEKGRVITKKKNEIKEEVFRQYSFRYRKQPTERLPRF